MRRLNRAKKVAAQSPCNYRHAAIVFKGGVIVAEAHNTQQMHAEVAALKHARIWTKAKRLTLLSVRITASGMLRCAKPCPACMKYMLDNGVSTVLYSTNDGRIERLRLKKEE